MPPQVDEMLLRIEDLDTRMEKLRGLYDQYFLGLERTEPQMQRTEVEKRLSDLRKQPLKSTALRFRFQQLVQRWTTYTTYWGRICRQIEDGTFKRDLLKARRLAERDKARAQKANEKAQDVYELDANDEDFDPSSLLGLEEVNTNAFDTERPAAPEVVEEVSIPRAPSTGFVAPAAPRAVPVPPESPNARVPAGASATASYPGVTPSVARGAAPPGASPPTAQPPVGAAAGRVALPPVHRKSIPPPGPVNSAVPGVPPTTRRASIPPTAGPPVAAPAPAPGGFALPPVHTPRVPTAPTGRLPSGVGLPPVNTPRIAPGATNNTPGPIARPVQAAPPPARPAPAAAPSAPSSGGGEDPNLRTLYQRYRDTRLRNGEGDVGYETLARQVRDTLPRLAQKYPGHEVSLDVTVKDGKTILRPVVRAKK